jgi:hypothetical protein
MIRTYLTNPSDHSPKHCALIDRTLEPGEVIPISEQVAAELLALEPTGFFVGYDEPDFDYHHAPRKGDTPTKGET